MRIRIGTAAAVVATLVTVWPAGLHGQQPQPGVIAGDPAKGAALLADARKALGGDDKLRAVKTLQLKGNFRRTQGNNQVQGELEILIELPGKMKRTEDTSAPGGGPATLSIQALNGTEVWDENTGGLAGFRGGFGGFGGRGGFGGGRGGGFGGGRGGRQAAQPDGQAPGAAAGRGNIDPEVIRQAQLRQRQGDLSRLLLITLLSTDEPVTWIGTAQAPEGTADVLEMRPTDGTAATRLFLDGSSHVPLMITWQGGGGGNNGGRRGGGAGRGGGQAARGGDQAAAPADGAAAPPADGAQAPAPAPQAQGGGRRGGGGPPATLRMTMSEYKAVNGIQLPHVITRGTNGQTTEEWSVDSYKVNQTFKANTFEQKQ